MLLKLKIQFFYETVIIVFQFNQCAIENCGKLSTGQNRHIDIVPVSATKKHFVIITPQKMAMDNCIPHHRQQILQPTFL
jgi:hypothetical protein